MDTNLLISNQGVNSLTSGDKNVIIGALKILNTALQVVIQIFY